MKCVVCHGENICVVVATPVCQPCGARYYDRKTVQYRVDLEAEGRAGRGNVRHVGKVLSYG